MLNDYAVVMLTTSITRPGNPANGSLFWVGPHSNRIDRKTNACHNRNYFADRQCVITGKYHNAYQSAFSLRGTTHEELTLDGRQVRVTSAWTYETHGQ